CQDASVELSATVQTSPPVITLNWVANAGATSYTIYRKPKFTSNWGAVVATLSGTDTQYIDTTAHVGTNYEYRVIRQAATYTGYGYVNAGIEIPAIESRGNLVLIVDQSMKDTLRHEIAQLIQDIEGDGWNVTEIDVDRASSPASVKTAIKALYDEHPAKTKAVFLLGHVPVPYSGDLNPDGHPDHLGAWPADVYYADMNGAWTDNAVNDAMAGDERNRNIPGDGKFDQSQIPTDVELQVGRVDFANMPSFALSESELLRQYLNKDHAFRNRYYKPVNRGVIDDNFGYFGSEAFASSGYKNLGPLVGPQQVMANDYFTTLADSNYLWSYGCGGGWYQGAGGIGSTADFAISHTQGVFTMLFGSYFGDWDSQDNFLRAPLAQGLTLTNAWSGRPHWVFHPMALGETVGYCAKLTQNNSATYYASYGARFVSIALMGDPSLRNQMIAPVSKLDVAAGQTGAVLTWNASPDDVAGYNI
ncbi:MAG TPA: fibronectin type III domain-containing protein, partial [Saprospiraceae bacterium]|nr:fibronectin type III domain-containing protein [Saprospiraceae bacterium]